MTIENVILDTMVLRYSLYPTGDREKEAAKKLLSMIKNEKLKGYIPVPVLYEFYYQLCYMSKLQIGGYNPNDFIEYFLNINNLELINISKDVAREGGKVYYKYNSIEENGKKRQPKKEERAQKKFLSAVDCLIIGISICNNFALCTNDDKIYEVSEINKYRPSELINSLNNSNDEVLSS